MNSKVIYESERAGGMGGATRIKLRSGGLAESGQVIHESERAGHIS